MLAVQRRVRGFLFSGGCFRVLLASEVGESEALFWSEAFTVATRSGIIAFLPREAHGSA